VDVYSGFKEEISLHDPESFPSLYVLSVNKKNKLFLRK